MRFSTKSRYAIRAMIDLALHNEGAPVPRADIARRQKVSSDYLAQLFRDLQSGGLVIGVKGPGGGYTLGRVVKEIDAAAIIQAVEGPIHVVNCERVHNAAEREHLHRCPAYWLWRKVDAAILDVLEGVTLHDLCERANEFGMMFDEACPEDTA